MKEKKENKKLFIILGIVLLLLIGGGSAYWFLIRDGAKDGGTNQGEEMVKDDRYVPDYEAKDIVDIAAEVETTLNEWSTDYRIEVITGVTRYFVDDLGELYFGTEGGKFSSWTFEVFSPSKKSVVIYSYTNGVGDLGDDIIVENEYALMGDNERAYFNDLTALKPTQEVYEVAVENGLTVGDGNHIYMYLGDGETTQTYGSRYVWRIDERSNTQLDEYDIPLILNTYFIDGKTLEVLE